MDQRVVERVKQIAEQRGLSMAQIAVAWLLQKETITAPIVGPTKISHIEDAVASLSVKLTPEENAQLEEPYVPHPVIGINV